MTRARKELVSPQITPYYHCVSRCVRRAFLCGEDSVTGTNYEHRKPWVVNRLSELADGFAIDVCAFAVMSNHTHLVLRLNVQKAQSWAESEVIRSWESFFHLPPLVQRYRRGELATWAERDRARQYIETWRERLTDISWFMRLLNEHIARKANDEDGCTGRFWEGRFKSQALVDEAAVVTCMSYVDLNPVRAGMCELPEDAHFTSIQQRIKALVEAKKGDDHTVPSTPPSRAPILMPLASQDQDPHPNAVGFLLRDYLQLIDWCGRALRDGKRGAIPEIAPPILERLQIDGLEFLKHVSTPSLESEPVILGRVDNIRAAVSKLPQSFVKGIAKASRLFPPSPT